MTFFVFCYSLPLTNLACYEDIVYCLGLVKKFLDGVGMSECKPKDTPCTIQPLGTDANDTRHSEECECSSAVGMLMCLSGNAHPGSQCAVHQCACFTHAPKHSHSVAVKRIAHHLKGVLDKKEGLTFTTTDQLNLDLFVDADHAGLWTCEDDQDPVCVKSRTGMAVTLGDCPMTWTSKLQTETALSTLEAECIALAQAMRTFVPLRRAFENMTEHFGLENDKNSESFVKSKVWEDNNGCIATCRAPQLSPRTKHIAVKCHFVRNFFDMDPTVKKDHPFVLKKVESEKQKADL